GDRPHHQGRAARRQRGAAGGALRHHEIRLALRARRLRAVSRDECTHLLPRGFWPRPQGSLGAVMPLVSEIDYGTLASKAEKQVTLTIDGFAVTVPEGTSIMRAAMEAGIKVPKLCATDMVEAFGSCRLCLVE